MRLASWPRIRSRDFNPQEQRVGVAVGSLLVMMIVLGAVGPRTYAFAVPAIACVMTAILVYRSPGLATVLRQSSPVFSAIGVFLLFAGLSALWAEAPMVSLAKVFYGAFLVALVLLVAGFLRAEATANVLRLAEGIWVGLFVAALYLCFEVYTTNALKIAGINALGLHESQVNPAKFMTWRDGKLVAIQTSALTRSMTPLVALLAPALLALAAAISAKWRLGFGVALLALVFGTIFGAGSETSKLALICGAIVGGVAYLSADWARRILILGWVGACLLVVPLTFLVHGLQLHNSPWLSQSMSGASPAVRIEILNQYAQYVVRRPLLGHGANMVYVLGPRIDKSIPEDERVHPHGLMRQHPHNAYMQVWFELGAVGAVLFAIAGGFILWSTRQLPVQIQPFGLATFAVCAAILAPSYGMWQFWYMAVFAATAIAFLIAARLARDTLS